MTEKPPPDWVIPKRTIAVATMQRSGSNLLGELMSQSDRLGHPGEYFSSHVLKVIAPGRGKTIIDRCLIARERGESTNGVVGIKFFPEQFPTPRTGIRFSEWFGTPTWIRLRRRDVLGQSISFVLARQQQAFISAATPKFDPVYSAEDISRTISELCVRDGRWSAYFARIGIEPLEIVYEDLEEDPERAIKAIAAAAEIDLGDFRLAPPRRFQKQRTALNQEWRERFLKEMGDPDLFSAPGRPVRGWLGSIFYRTQPQPRPRK